MHVRTIFCKTTAMRFTGHLDVQRALERIFRRARLPLAYTQGFSPHARITLASPLALGFTSSGEIADFWLDNDLPIPEIQSALEQAAPPGIVFRSFTPIEQKEDSVASRVTAAAYFAAIPARHSDIEKAVVDLLDSPELPRERRNKPYDLRPLIEDLILLPEDTCKERFSAIPYQGVLDDAFHTWETVISMRLCAEGGKTGRPDEVIDALGASPLESHIHREKIILRDG